VRLTTQIKKITGEPYTGTGIDPQYETVLKENLTAHLRHTMHFFYSSRPNVSVQKLIVSGDCATIPYLLEFIKQETNIETELADPFSNMKLDTNINTDELHKSAPGLMLSCGLALSKI
jgi:type IV pilus assembly protein PilM